MNKEQDVKKVSSALLKRKSWTRRGFVKASGAAAAVITTGIGTSAFASAPAQRVSEDGPMAAALNYVHDARTVDAAKRLSSQFCNNCALYAGTAQDEWAKCSIFPGKLVAGAGWCSAWAPKQES